MLGGNKTGFEVLMRLVVGERPKDRAVAFPTTKVCRRSVGDRRTKPHRRRWFVALDKCQRPLEHMPEAVSPLGCGISTGVGSLPSNCERRMLTRFALHVVASRLIGQIVHWKEIQSKIAPGAYDRSARSLKDQDNHQCARIEGRDRKSREKSPHKPYPTYHPA